MCSVLGVCPPCREHGNIGGRAFLLTCATGPRTAPNPDLCGGGREPAGMPRRVLVEAFVSYADRRPQTWHDMTLAESVPYLACFVHRVAPRRSRLGPATSERGSVDGPGTYRTHRDDRVCRVSVPTRALIVFRSDRHRVATGLLIRTFCGRQQYNERKRRIHASTPPGVKVKVLKVRLRVASALLCSCSCYGRASEGSRC